MDTEKATVRLKLDKDELATLTARIYQESGHGLAPDDPIIVQYLMHKIMLTQFLETQGKAMTAFADSLLPHILETEGRFEENKAAFVEHLANAKKESLQAVHDQYTTMVKGTLDQVRKLMATELETVSRSMRVESGGLSRMLDEQRGRFRETVESFKKALRHAAYIVGGALLISTAGVILWFSRA